MRVKTTHKITNPPPKHERFTLKIRSPLVGQRRAMAPLSSSSSYCVTVSRRNHNNNSKNIYQQKKQQQQHQQPPTPTACVAADCHDEAAGSPLRRWSLFSPLRVSLSKVYTKLPQNIFLFGWNSLTKVVSTIIVNIDRIVPFE